MAKDADFLREARKRFQSGIDADLENRKRDEEDRKFFKGEMWTDAELKERNGRITLKIPRLGQFVKQVTGEMRQNKPAIRVLPKEEGNEELSKVYSAIIRHIESLSDAHRIYNKAAEQAVIGGIGWFRVLTEYLDEHSFDQEIIIKPIRNPLSVVIDPDARELTRHDMNWAFVTELVSKAKFEKQYPKVGLIDFESPNDEFAQWVQGEFVRVAEYWYKKPVKKTLARFSDGSTDYTDDIDLNAINQARMAQGLEPVMVVEEREVEVQKVCWCRMTGADIIDKGEWNGKYIPLIPVIGEEIEAGDEIYRHGLIHNAKDAQKSYNYARSAMVEHIGNQPKSPYLATANQIKNYKSMWENANSGNPPVLIYDPDPSAPGAPQRVQPPTLPQAWYKEAEVADGDMKATTGIYDASLGERSNETSGRAIIARDQQGETATYVYIDNLVASIRLCGLMLIDLIPHIYSNERIIRIVGEDGSIEAFAQVNTRLPNGMTWNDLSQGTYDVEVTTGPAYATKRQQAADWMMQFVQAYPPAAQVAGDLMVKAMDLPNADKLAHRLKMLLPPGVDPEADQQRMEMQQQMQPPPDPMQQMMQELQMRGMAAGVAKTEWEAAKVRAEAQSKPMVDGYNAETNRIKAITAKDFPLPPEAVALLAPVVTQAVMHALASPDILAPAQQNMIANAALREAAEAKMQAAPQPQPPPGV